MRPAKFVQLRKTSANSPADNPALERTGVTWETRILGFASATTPAAKLLRELVPDLTIVTPKAFADLIKSQAPNTPIENP